MKKFLTAFFITFVFALIFGYSFMVRAELRKNGMAAIKFVGGCEIWILDKVWMGENTVVVACPGREHVRVWPWPVERWENKIIKEQWEKL